MNLYSFFAANSPVAITMVNIFIINIILLYILIFINNGKYDIFKFSKNKYKKNLQTIHTGYISRFGGVAIVLTFFLLVQLLDNYNDKLLLTIFLFGVPIIIIGFIEDLYQNIHPIYRLSILFIASLILFIFAFNNLPLIDIPFLGKWINIPIISVIFYSLALTGYINGVNFIDGTNGLASFSLLSSFLSLLFLTITFQDIENARMILYAITLIASFLLFNYPFGKIFLGDLGAYFLAWFLGIITIYVMNQNPAIPNWCAVCILGYPMIEVIFSFSRKILSKKNPALPDRSHLHLKLYLVLSEKIENKIAANSLVAPFISLIWLLPLILIPWIYFNKFLIIIAIIIQILIYILYYRFIPAERKLSK